MPLHGPITKSDYNPKSACFSLASLWEFFKGETFQENTFERVTRDRHREFFFFFAHKGWGGVSSGVPWAQ